MPEVYDIIVVGAGPAGMTAAIYARRAARTVLVLEAVSYGGVMLRVRNLTRTSRGKLDHVSFDVPKGEMIGVVGNTVEQAQSALSALGIRSICIDEETASYLPGTVLRQSLEEGALVDPNSQTVTLYVASAPPPAEPEDEEQPEAGA